MMNPLEIIGQETIWKHLASIFKRDKIGNAYLFHGSEGSGKEAIALKFSSLLNCLEANNIPCFKCASCMKYNSLQHPNLTIVVPLPIEKKISKDDPPLKALSTKTITTLTELIRKKGQDPYVKIKLSRGNTILINSIREIRKKVYLKTIEPGRKMILIFESDKLMSQEGASGNALLKILEEPPSSTTLILCTEHPERLNATIRSRCQSIFFPPILENQIKSYLERVFKIPKEQALLMARLSQGNIMMAKQLANSDIVELSGILKTMVSWAASGNENGWRKFLAHVASTYRSNPTDLIFQFQLLSFWFRDALYAQKFNGSSHFIMLILEKEIKEFSNRFPHADYTKIIVAIEKCANSLKQNFQLNLVVMSLLMEVRDGLGHSA